mmetsp:Transcript_31862/g.87229  ORF Transcript_31862/g.87229 Transcript_31862/m.87229 type:complete len:222 (+) Transcript_31862:695-1360(+)
MSAAFFCRFSRRCSRPALSSSSEMSKSRLRSRRQSISRIRMSSWSSIGSLDFSSTCQSTLTPGWRASSSKTPSITLPKSSSIEPTLYAAIDCLSGSRTNMVTRHSASMKLTKLICCSASPRATSSETKSCDQMKAQPASSMPIWPAVCGVSSEWSTPQSSSKPRKPSRFIRWLACGKARKARSVSPKTSFCVMSRLTNAGFAAYAPAVISFIAMSRGVSSE